MNLRFLLSFLLLMAVAVTGGFSQTGVYGSVTNHLKAGDPAPEFTFTKILNVPLSPSGSSSQSGKLTVISFCPNTSANLQLVTTWNALVDQFAGKSVRFVWITGEKESTLLPWLSQHSVKGWVYYDPKGGTGKAFGLEWAESVLLGEDQRILGYTMLPNADLVSAALDGRVTTTPPTKATIRAFIESRRVLLGMEPFKMPRVNDGKPDLPPSYVLHVAPSQTEGKNNSMGPDFWNLRGYNLKEVIAEIYGVNPIRIYLPAALDNDKEYDFAMVLPQAASDQNLRDRFRKGLENHFHITATRENRFLEVYVVTAPEGKLPAAKVQAGSEELGGESGSLGFETAGGPDEPIEGPKVVNLAAITSVRTDGTLNQFCNFLESELDRPVVNETSLEGAYEFDVESSKPEKNDFLDRLRSQLGLVITPTQRSIEVLAFQVR